MAGRRGVMAIAIAEMGNAAEPKAAIGLVEEMLRRMSGWCTLAPLEGRPAALTSASSA